MSKWCWATSARMMSRYYYPAVSRTQSQAVTHVKGQLVNYGGWENESRDAILYYIDNVTGDTPDLRYCISDGSASCRIFSETTLKKFLNDGHVVYITRSWYNSSNNRTGGHAYVVSGYTTSYNGSEIEYKYIVHDPWPADGATRLWSDTPDVTSGQILTRTYEWICNGKTVGSTEENDNGIWEGFVVVNTPYSTDTILPAYDW